VKKDAAAETEGGGRGEGREVLCLAQVVAQQVRREMGGRQSSVLSCLLCSQSHLKKERWAKTRRTSL
jgi:hypothetical protein